jgi:multidrug resistance protein MdtO
MGTGSSLEEAVRAKNEDLPFRSWFVTFLREELSPYPGRANLVVRMAIAATITMLIIMTFRLPGAAIAGYYTLLLSRDSPQTTLRSSITVLGAYLVCAAYCMLGVLLFIDDPVTHFLFVVFSFFLSFFLIKVSTNYVGAAGFAFTIGIVIPIWDVTQPTDVLVKSTLWAATSVTVGLAATVAVEYGFNLFDPRDPLLEGIESRLLAISHLLSQCCSWSFDGATRKQIEQYGTVGVSRLRRLAARSYATPWHSARGTTVVSLVGRLIDLSNATLHLSAGASPGEAPRFQALADQIDALRAMLRTGQTLHGFEPSAPARPAASPLLPEMERTVQLLVLNFSEPATDDAIHHEVHEADTGFLVHDAFTNPEHLLFSLRGCLAASLCYVILNAIAWHGLNTSIATCMVTALSTVGSSRQKQMLRLAGALIGGLLFGIGSQVLILPMLDDIGGFTILFAVVTVIAAWISTASARLSYLGLQLALAFYLIYLQEFSPQTNLAIARDRVAGVALGLAAMWLVFDRLGGRPAAELMVKKFNANLRLLAQLAEPWPIGRDSLDRPHIDVLRDRVFANFAEVNAQADAVFLEIGTGRRVHLEWRSAIRAWQPSLRGFFVIQIALLQYRLELSPAQLAPAVVDALRALDAEVKRSLESLADSLEHGRPIAAGTDLPARLADLERAIVSTYTVPTPRAQGVLSLSSHLVAIVDALQLDVQATLAHRLRVREFGLLPAENRRRF